ncbi:MAG: hypothetical protein A2068_09235 [Ignavibacteria bacterium GWB2_35_6b]|nr:MAG: hypothetical protein A2068_09235 [Ignavibacteria bacterium GWB2_35_6b]
MKNQITTLTVTVILFALLTAAFVFASDVNAQGLKSQRGRVVIEKYELPVNAVKSLIMGIKSDNDGLRKSAIFYAGQYKLEAAVDCLIEELQKEEDSSTKILIALSLYKIGNPIAIDYIKEVAANDENENVKNMFSTIYNEFIFDTSFATAKK